jgi:oxygen-independent coproporphyrinogen-3 oxidase
MGAMAEWGLYVHVPFCPCRCTYCDFVAVGPGPRVARWHAPYLRAVAAEGAYWARALQPGPPATVYYGGGTPTAVGAEALAELHAALAHTFDLRPGTEVTVECNPETVDAEGLARLRAAGVTRLSVGLQAVQEQLLRRLGRGHTFADAARAVAAARRAGLESVNVDVMCGLPGQGCADLAETLARVVALGPDHVSVYALQVEDGTVLAAELRRGRLALPGEDEVAEQLALARRLLAEAGYEHYEISNWARPGRRCRHNLLYWENGDYLGLGVGAHSHWGGARWANTRRLAVYVGALEGPAAEAVPPPWAEAYEPPDPSRERSEGAILGLRLLEGLDLAAYARRYGVPLGAAFPGAVEQLVAAGLCEVAEGRLRLRPEAVALGNRAFAAFV